MAVYPEGHLILVSLFFIVAIQTAYKFRKAGIDEKNS
jgi:hypothetical protein